MIRIGLFLATNLAVLFILYFILTGLSLHQPETNWMPMLIMAGIFGMSGSFISLLLSKTMIKRSSGAPVIESPSSKTEGWLVRTVHTQADQVA